MGTRARSFSLPITIELYSFLIYNTIQFILSGRLRISVNITFTRKTFLQKVREIVYPTKWWILKSMGYLIKLTLGKICRWHNSLRCCKTRKFESCKLRLRKNSSTTILLRFVSIFANGVYHEQTSRTNEKRQWKRVMMHIFILIIRYSLWK